MARISIFTGREARLNKAIFWILAKQSPLTIYDIWQKLREQRDFVYMRYHTVNRRVRALEKRGYVGKSGERKTKTGFIAILHQLTARAYLAILLDRISLDSFIEKTSEAGILSLVLEVISTDI
jgi:hypothetical protein